jgi:hypothetical protein
LFFVKKTQKPMKKKTQKASNGGGGFDSGLRSRSGVVVEE